MVCERFNGITTAFALVRARVQGGGEGKGLREKKRLSKTEDEKDRGREAERDAHTCTRTHARTHARTRTHVVFFAVLFCSRQRQGGLRTHKVGENRACTCKQRQHHRHSHCNGGRVPKQQGHSLHDGAALPMCQGRLQPARSQGGERAQRALVPGPVLALLLLPRVPAACRWAFCLCLLLTTRAPCLFRAVWVSFRLQCFVAIEFPTPIACGEQRFVLWTCTRATR